MKYLFITILLFALLLTGCSDTVSVSNATSDNSIGSAIISIDNNSVQSNTSAATSHNATVSQDNSSISDIVSTISNTASDVSAEISKGEESSMIKEPNITNLTYSNGSGKMGDTDGPAYVVYSKKGYNKASIDVLVSQIELNNVRKRDKKFVNAYIFLGIDVYDANGNWVNCFDTGLCYSGVGGDWHLFYNLYTTVNKSTLKWYESTVKLNPKHDYRLILDSSKKDGMATMTIFDITDKKIADSKELEAAFTLADGSNTSFLQNFALDYPEDVKLDTSKKASDDPVEITYYNTDQGIYMKNLNVENAKIYKSDAESDWTEQYTQNRSVWPDKNIKFDYEVVKVWADSFDNKFTVEFDMNR